MCGGILGFECDEKRSATQHLGRARHFPSRFECDEKRSATNRRICRAQAYGLWFECDEERSATSPLQTIRAFHQIGLNAMKSGVQRILRKPVLPPVCEFECDEERSATLWRFQLWRCQEMFESNEERGCVEEKI